MADRFGAQFPDDAAVLQVPDYQANAMVLIAARSNDQQGEPNHWRRGEDFDVVSQE